MNARSLTFRLVSWYCGLLFVLGAAFAAYTYISFDRNIQETTRATLSGRADALWGMAAGLLNDRNALAALIEQRFAPEIQDRFIRIGTDDDVVYRSGIPAEGAFDPSTVPRATTETVRQVGKLLIVTQLHPLSDGRLATVESGQSVAPMEAAEAKLATSLLVGLPLLLILAAIGGYVLMEQALAPVEAMIGAAEALTFNSPRNRLPLAGTGDRIDALGRTLNRMLERLDGAYQHASRFSADAAHELRTPLTIMRGELELLAATPALPADIQTAVGSILEETVRLSQIVSSLIAMSQLDSIAGKRTHRLVDLRALALETIDQMKLLADEKAIAITGPDGLPVIAAGDHDRLKQVLVNLLDNAIKYTGAGGRVTVAVSETPEAAVLTVADTGIGIAPEHQARIFERFFRASTDRGEIGAGLGLAIVRSICVAHGGKITVESTLSAGSTFRVELPPASVHLVPAAPQSNMPKPQGGGSPAPGAINSGKVA